MIINFWGRLKRRLLAINAYFTVKNDLERLSDYQLMDVGLSRSDIEYYAIRAYRKADKGY